MEPGGRGAGNLPAELTSFVGRRDEVAEVRRLLTESRLVTLTGAGGVGKTRLALRAAGGLTRAFGDGVWLVRLDQLRAEALVPQATATTLGLRQRAGDSRVAALAEHLAGRHLLLVLDNCEHLVNAVAKLVDLLLRAAPGLRVLATSREALNIAGETVLPVPPLAVPQAGQPLTVAELRLFPAVRLFAERAAQVVPGFSVTEANMAAVAGICRRLEGLPLALELAAARARVLSPEQIDARLGSRLGLLTRGGRTNPERQQTLRASIEWSYELCSGPERLLWERLSVFADGFELDAAEGICADHRLAAWEVLELLAALADKSILRTEYGEHGVRYQLTETLREYGLDRLRRAGEHDVMRRRHRDWHERLARQVDSGWNGPQAAGLVARLFREHANVRAAQDSCLSLTPPATPGTDPDAAEAALRIALHVWRFYYWDAGYVAEGRYRVGQALAQVREPTAWRAQGLLLASLLAAISGDHGAAQAQLAEGTRLAGELDDGVARAFGSYCAGVGRLCAGELPSAISHYEDGLATAPAADPAADSGRLRALLLAALMSAAALAGDEERVTACDRDLATLTEAGDDLVHGWRSARSQWALGLLSWHQGALDRATGLQQQSLRRRDGRHDRLGVTDCLETLAWAAASARQYERAAVLLGAAAGRRRSMALTLEGQQHLAACHADCEFQARRALGEAAFQAACDRGLRLPDEDAARYALEQPPAPDKSPAPDNSPAPAPPLTRRETQVARLVAEGQSNREIAARLVISQRTAEGHVEHILTKLGFTSRAQIAAWIAASQSDDDRR